MNKNVEYVRKIYIDAGFNLTNHSFKAVGENQVRVTIRTTSRIHSDSRYTINLFCDPLYNAGLTIVKYTTKAAPKRTHIPICNILDPVDNARIQKENDDYSRSLKGTLSILVEIPGTLVDKFSLISIDSDPIIHRVLINLLDALRWELDTLHTNTPRLMNDCLEWAREASKPIWGNSRYEVWIFYSGMKYFVTGNIGVMVFCSNNESVEYVKRHKIHYPGHYYQIREIIPS